MRYEISKQAEQDLINIETYLLEEWNIDILEDFFEKFQKAITLLLEKKTIFQKYEDTHFHKFLLTKHNSIIYYYGDDVLYIQRILQNFQDPDDNQKSLKS
ncbi:type II toxin-antitoxin system RelE/ParE family toxin [Epilithonimonas sp. JDS]|uniref:type II toxin-antitoxin system RelE/ParE family toxin n=1 Tax=Epilithonimonas sp. JDS TaxID=2902797 RepID=UPI001E6485E0|nr:type II toxin-antitoxin system RelE/ParE family toxin [Epilithonimonas sp. JDS]MCD9854705.1 type II toxin-antitoxin system RelE/ParE family toxin [Epilithonimonas sp. JDS]